MVVGEGVHAVMHTHGVDLLLAPLDSVGGADVVAEKPALGVLGQEHVEHRHPHELPEHCGLARLRLAGAMCGRFHFLKIIKIKDSASGTRTRVFWVKAKYPNHLD